MELFQLRSFLQVAESGTITGAAEVLCVTQPAVTHHVRALERELGVALFDRTGRGVLPTPAGEALRDYARRCVGLLDECRQVIAELEAGAVGRLALGVGVTTSIFHLPGWLRVFREVHPGIDVTVRTGRSREVAALALEREIDLGLVTSAVRHPDLRHISLYEEEIVLVAPRGQHPAGRALTAAELARTPLILFPRGTGFRAYLERVLEPALAGVGRAPLVKMESDSAEAIKSFVAVGLGAAFLPAAAVAAEIASGELARLEVEDLPPLRRRTSITYRRDRRLSAGAQAFLKMLCARYNQDLDAEPAPEDVLP
jgi:DNA-binding transcriptional LysR family regulator